MQTTTKLKYLDYGKGPTIVLLHDVSLSPVSWRRQTPVLAQAGFRVIVPELVGLSGVPSLATYGQAVFSLLNRLGISRFAVCGLGMGGSVALELMAANRQRVVGACLINSRPGNDDFHEKYKRAEIISACEQGDDGPARRELLSMLMGGREEYFDPEIRLEILKALCSLDRKGLVFNLKAMQSRKNHVKLLAQLELPVLLIAGRADRICHAGYAGMMAGRLVNCNEVVTMDGGHLLPLEQAEALNAKLVEFLRAIAPERRKVYLLSSRQAA